MTLIKVPPIGQSSLARLFIIMLFVTSGIRSCSFSFAFWIFGKNQCPGRGYDLFCAPRNWGIQVSPSVATREKESFAISRTSRRPAKASTNSLTRLSCPRSDCWARGSCRKPTIERYKPFRWLITILTDLRCRFFKVDASAQPLAKWRHSSTCPFPGWDVEAEQETRRRKESEEGVAMFFVSLAMANVILKKAMKRSSQQPLF